MHLILTMLRVECEQIGHCVAVNKTAALHIFNVACVPTQRSTLGAFDIVQWCHAIITEASIFIALFCGDTIWHKWHGAWLHNDIKCVLKSLILIVAIYWYRGVIHRSITNTIQFNMSVYSLLRYHVNRKLNDVQGNTHIVLRTFILRHSKI